MANVNIAAGLLTYGSSSKPDSAEKYAKKKQDQGAFKGSAESAFNILGITGTSEEDQALLMKRYDTKGKKGDNSKPDGTLSLSEMAQIILDTDSERNKKSGSINQQERKSFFQGLSQQENAKQTATQGNSAAVTPNKTDKKDSATSDGTTTGEGEKTTTGKSPKPAEADSSSPWQKIRTNRRGDKESVNAAIESELTGDTAEEAMNSYTVKSGDTYYDMAEAMKSKYKLEQSVDEIAAGLEKQVGQDTQNLKVGTEVNVKEFLGKVDPETKTESKPETKKEAAKKHGQDFVNFLGEGDKNSVSSNSKFENAAESDTDGFGFGSSMNQKELKSSGQRYVDRHNKANPDNQIKLVDDKKLDEVFSKANDLHDNWFFDINITQEDMDAKGSDKLFNSLFIPVKTESKADTKQAKAAEQKTTTAQAEVTKKDDPLQAALADTQFGEVLGSELSETKNKTNNTQTLTAKDIPTKKEEAQSLIDQANASSDPKEQAALLKEAAALDPTAVQANTIAHTPITKDKPLTAEDATVLAQNALGAKETQEFYPSDTETKEFIELSTAAQEMRNQAEALRAEAKSESTPEEKQKLLNKASLLDKVIAGEEVRRQEILAKRKTIE